MRKQFLLDAVETITNIHKGDFSSLRGKSFVICDSMKKKRRGKPVKKSNKGKMTLAKLTVTVNDLSMTVNDLSMTVNNLSMTVNNLSMTVNNLAKEMRAGFNRIESRLDYIVKANDLKDLPKTK